MMIIEMVAQRLMSFAEAAQMQTLAVGVVVAQTLKLVAEVDQMRKLVERAARIQKQ